MSRHVLRNAVLCIVIAGSAVIVGCATLDELAPPVDDSMVRAAAAEGTSRDRIERGRITYITQCAQCHSPEPVERYTVGEWREILPRMNQKADLSDPEAADLRSYVRAVLDTRNAVGIPPS